MEGVQRGVELPGLMKKHGSSSSRNEGWLKSGKQLAGVFGIGIAVAAGASLSLNDEDLWKQPESLADTRVVVPENRFDVANQLSPIQITAPLFPFSFESVSNSVNSEPDNSQVETAPAESVISSEPQRIQRREIETPVSEVRENSRTPAQSTESNRPSGIAAPPAPVIGRIPPVRPTPKPTPSPIFSPL